VLPKSAPRTPSSARSISPSYQVNQYKIKGKINNREQHIINHKNFIQSYHSKNSMLNIDWLPTSRPMSQNSVQISETTKIKKQTNKNKKQSNHNDKFNVSYLRLYLLYTQIQSNKIRCRYNCTSL